MRLVLAILILSAVPSHALEDGHRRFYRPEFNQHVQQQAVQTQNGGVTVYEDNSWFVGPNQAADREFYGRMMEFGE